MTTLRYPFPSHMSPHADAAERHAIEWACSHGLVREDHVARARLTRVGIGSLVGRSYPGASRAALLTCAEWLTWLFIYDDLCDETEAAGHPDAIDRLRAQLLGVLEGEVSTVRDVPLAAALGEVCARIGAQGQSDCAPRLAKLMEMHFFAARWQAENRARGQVPDLESYRRLRRHSGAVYTCFALIDIAAGIALPDEVRDDETVGRLGDLANDVISFCNDVVSLRKEDGDVHNLVVVLEHQHGLPREEALRRAMDMHNDALAEFVALADRLPSFGPALDGSVGGYVDGLRTCMRGNLDWSLMTRRYRPTEPPSAVSVG